MSVFTDKMDAFEERFENVVLQKSKISKSDFEDCTFVGCDLSESQFSSCRFIRCRFENCNLSLLKLPNTQFSDVEFIECKMIGIDWTKCDWQSRLEVEPMRFRGSLLNDSSFFGLSIPNTVMKECRIKEVDFRQAKLQNANFSHSDMEGALFWDTHLENADFSGCENLLLDMRTCHLKGAKMGRYDALAMMSSLGIVLVD